MIDATGATATFGSDAAGRMTGLTDPLGETLVWAYDNIGNRIRQENRADPPLTASVQWTYDGAGRVLTRLADGVTTTSTYDAVGNKLTASDGTLTITTDITRHSKAQLFAEVGKKTDVLLRFSTVAGERGSRMSNAARPNSALTR